MNVIKNDLGQDVIALGSPGSLARVKVQYPALIQKLVTIDKKAARALIKAAGITSTLETESLLEAAGKTSGNPSTHIHLPPVTRDGLRALGEYYGLPHTKDVIALLVHGELIRIAGVG